MEKIKIKDNLKTIINNNILILNNNILILSIVCVNNQKYQREIYNFFE